MNVIGLDIGGTKCAVVLANTDGKKITILKKKRFATDNRQPAMEIIDQFCSIIDQFTKKTSVEAIGISCGGPLDSRTGVIKRPPNLPMWDDIHICDILSRKYGVPARLQNDANACALAEWMYGAGRGPRNMAFLTFGTGLGAGLILDGRLYCGTNDNGGEFGHIRLSENGPVGYGKVGSFEPGYEFDALLIDDKYLNYDNYTLEQRLERYIYLGDDRDIKRRFCRGVELTEPVM